MAGDVIPFPGPKAQREILEEERVSAPFAIFEIDDKGRVDLAQGITVTDAVAAFWDAVQGTVAESWASHPLGRETARVRLLTAYLDKVRPGWREELAWKI